jgi:hypothetical protein
MTHYTVIPPSPAVPELLLVVPELCSVSSIAARLSSEDPIRVNKLPNMFSSAGVRFFPIATATAFASKVICWPGLKQLPTINTPFYKIV